MGKTKQRGNGQGTVVRIKRGTRVRYAAELTVGWQAGKRIKKRGEMRATKIEAVADLEKLKHQHARAIDIKDNQTLRTFLVHHLTDVVPIDTSARTPDTYQWAATHINRDLGDTELKKIGGQQIQRFVTSLTKDRKLKPKSVQLIFTVLNGALKAAQQYKLIDDNPARGTRLPPIPKSKPAILTPEQALRFLEAAKGERLEVGLRIMLSLGLRRGEVAGLRWSDINFDKGTLTVNGTLGYVRGRGLVYDDPKSESGERTVKLPQTLLVALRQHQHRLQAERRAMVETWQDEDNPYVFVGAMRGQPLNSEAFYVAVKRVAKRAGLSAKLSPHSLRHSCASFLYAEGVPDKAISAFLGHASITITRELYVHLLGGELDDAAEHIERLLDVVPVATSEDEESIL